jgi:hypothetical protein
MSNGNRSTTKAYRFSPLSGCWKTTIVRNPHRNSKFLIVNRTYEIKDTYITVVSIYSC